MANFDNSETTKSKWSLRTFKEYLQTLKYAGETKAAKNLDIDNLFDQISAIVVKTIISAEPLLWNGVEMYLPNTY